MNKFENNNSRDFFEVYAKTKNDQLIKRRKIRITSSRSKLKKFFTIVFIIFTIICVGFFAIFNYFFGNFRTNADFKKSCEDLGVQTMEKINKDITNIALFGVDKRKNEKTGRSDATLILTLDGNKNKIKLTTLMRDSRVKIDGHGLNKLCHAYSYGGANLAVKTINKNFNLDIHDYITVNFSQMAKVVDKIGGLDIEITQAEVNSINGLLNSTDEFKKCPRVSRFPGPKQTVHLTGAQVLQYSRIRDIDSDIKRTERQQNVLNLIFEKLKKLEKIKLVGLAKTLLGIIETSLTVTDILKFYPFLKEINPNSIKKFKIPDPNDHQNVHPGKINGVWYWNFDLPKYANILHNFIYKDDEKSNSN